MVSDSILQETTQFTGSKVERYVSQWDKTWEDQIARRKLLALRQDKGPAHLSRLSQTGGSGSSFGAMMALSEECQLSPITP